MTFWVYKVRYDSGAAPHVGKGLLSLAICKPGIRKGAVAGDVIFGFAGRSRPANRGERLIYVARVTEKLAKPGEYYERPEYRDRWDCIYERHGEYLEWRLGSLFHKHGSGAAADLGPAPEYPRAIVLLSDDFRYLGADGTMEYAARWPKLGRFIHELGIGQRRIDPASRAGRMLFELQQELWRSSRPGGGALPTEPQLRPPAWAAGGTLESAVGRGSGCAPARRIPSADLRE
jgi:Nucleotide modification associated domain 2